MKSYLKIIIAIVIGVLLGSTVSFIMKNDKCDVVNEFWNRKIKFFISYRIYNSLAN